jgi:hypothetical protein
MAFSSSDFWVFKTPCRLWFIGLCGFLLGIYGVFGGNAAHPSTRHLSVFGRFSLFQ